MADTAQFPPGAMLDDKYRIDQLVAVGGMGAVYVGMHTLLKKRVAIKVLRTELAGAVNMVERFQREAIAASGIGHDNIVSVTDMGNTNGGVAFLVMELLEGRSLAAAIKDEAPMGLEQVADIAHGILAGLGAAHGAGIVHRDMKPENIFLAARPGGREVVKILDFGISSIAAQQNPEPRLTITGIVMGTPNYMAPEQARGDRDINGAADIYSLGVILYEMLTGQIPYEAENYNLLMHRVLSGEYVKLRLRRPDVPPELAAIIDKAMMLNARDRYATAGELDQALAPFRSDGGLGAAAAAEGVPRAPTAPRKQVVVQPPTGGDPHVSTAQTLMAVSSSHAAATAPVATSGRTSRAPLYALIGVALLAGGGGLAVALKKNSGAGSKEQAAAPNPAPAPTPGPAVDPTPKPTPDPTPVPVVQPVIIDFALTPADARILVDGKPIAGSRVQVPSSQTPIAVRVEADGYEPYLDTVVPDHSERMVVKLEKARVAGQGKPGRPGKPVVDKTKPPVVDPPPTDDPNKPPKKPDKIITDSPYGP